MRFVCLWSPRWRTGAAPRAEVIAALLEDAPRVAAEARGVVWADARGLPALPLATALRECLRGDGAGVKAGIAATPIVAEAAARTGAEAVTVVAPGGERAFLAPLPLSVLGPEPRLLALLEGTGVGTCGALAPLTREAVEVRFGAAAAALWRLARADDPRILFAPIPRERAHGSVDFVDYAVRDAARLAFAANALLGTVCTALAERGERARRMVLRLPLAGGGALERVLRTARPTAERAVWLARLREELDRLALPDAVTGVGLWVEDTEAASGVQGDLFDRGFATAAPVEEAVSRLVDTLGPVFVAPDTFAHPLAERRTVWMPVSPAAVAEGGAIATGVDAPALVLQLLAKPRRVAVRTRARRDHLLPAAYRDRGRWHTLAEAAGPDRVSGGHDGDAFAREYWRCATEAGCLVWLFRDALRDFWYLHGYWE